MINNIPQTKPSSLDDYGMLLTVSEVAQLLRVSTRTVYRLSDAGELPAVKIGKRLYFPKSRLEALFQTKCIAEMKVQ